MENNGAAVVRTSKERITLSDYTISNTISNTMIMHCYDLPMVKFKEDGITYEVTNITPLNQRAIAMFWQTIEAVHLNSGMQMIEFKMQDGTDQETAGIIAGIFMAMRWKASRRGGRNRKGFTAGGCMFTATEIWADRGERFRLRLDIAEGFADAVDKCIQDGCLTIDRIAVNMGKSLCKEIPS